MAIKYGRLISTRTPHAGSDGTGADIIKASDEFQPALPMRGVTDLGGRRLYVYEISTRTPHAGSDRRRGVALERATISTRTPHAGSDPG